MSHNPREIVMHAHVQATSNVWKDHKRECAQCTATNALYDAAHAQCMEGTAALDEFKIASSRLTDAMFD